MKTSSDKAFGFSMAAAVLFCWVATASAEIKNFTFRGTVSVVDDLGFSLDGSITNGATFEGFYIFESTATDSNADPTVGDYAFTDNRLGLAVLVGNYVFRSNPRHVALEIETVNRPGDDHYLVRSRNNVCSQPLTMGEMSWQLDDITGAAVTSDVLPIAPPDLAAFSRQFGLSISVGCDPTPGLVRGTVNSIVESPAVIPERPVTEIGDAVEIRWPSRMGYFYQIQRSDDASNWANVGEPILGDGKVLSKFFPRQSGTNAFYRAEIANFPK